MIHEEAYKAQHLYNSINEYLYFIIVYIEQFGPQPLNGLQKYVKFFKKEFQNFIQIFNGENQEKKISNLLCSTTTAFFVKEETVHLSKSYDGFKRNIYEDLIKSKVVDLVLRGISSIHDICANLNLNHVISISEDTFLNALKHCSYFYIDADSLVTVLQFHGLIGFDNCVYKTITEYFQGYLQKVDALTYDEINLHSRFVPSCGVQNSLVLFCVFYISDVFKCKNMKVSIKKNWKIKTKNQQRIDVDQLNGRCHNGISISELVCIAHGPILQKCTGEIIRLNKHIGFIQCVVDFKGDYHGVFSIFFDITALKFVCDTENLENYLNIRDTVEFDAEFCDKTTIKDRYWKALQVTVTKQGLRRNKYKLKIDTEEYIESIKFKNKLNSSLDSYSSNNQCISSLAYDMNMDVSKISSCCIRNLSNTSLNFSNGTTSLPTTQTTCMQDLKQTENFSDQVLIPSNDSMLTSNSSKDLPLTLNTMNASILNGQILEVHKDKCQSSDTISLYTSQSVLDSAKTNFKQYVQQIAKEQLHPTNEILHKNRVLVPNFLFSHSTFVFAEVAVITENEGIAISLNSDHQCEIFFKTESILIHKDAKFLPEEGNKVLLFIPHGSCESTLCVATLVYRLDEEESALISGNYEWVQDFVIEYFFPRLKLIYNIDACNCDLSGGLFLIDTIKTASKKGKGFVTNCEKILMDLKELFIFDEKTSKNFQVLVERFCLQNLGMNEIKLYACIALQVFKSLPCYWKFKAFSKFKNGVRDSESHLLPPHLVGKRVNLSGLNLNSVSSKSESPLGLYSGNKKVKFESKNYSSLTMTRLNEYDKNLQENPAFESGRASCSSLSSYISCNSKYSSEERFHSCDSLSSKPTSDSETDLKSDHSQNDSAYETSHTVLSTERDVSSPELFSPTETMSKFPEIQITYTGENELYFTKGENKINSRDKNCTKFKFQKITSSLKQTNKKKQKTRLKSKKNFCKCQKQLVETTACISSITNSGLLLSAKSNEQSFILSFPKCLIPKEIWTSIKLNSMLKITIIPHALIQLSRILYVEFHVN